MGDLEAYCRKLPKVELHAHLNGSLSKATIEKLVELKMKKVDGFEGIKDYEQVIIDAGHRRTIEEVFSMFPIIHGLTDSLEAIQLAAEDVVKDFYEENVYYLELRSTPKGNMNDYVQAMMKGVALGVHQCPNMHCYLLLSIDRRMSPAVANQVVDVAIQNMLDEITRPFGVVGIDLSGDPAIDGRQFLPALDRARKAGLKTSLHLAEVNSDIFNAETSDMLGFGPDRIGHGTFMRPDDGGRQAYVDTILRNTIPLELCLTSNVKGGTVNGFSNHHFGAWFSDLHPVILCTDDKGIFDTSLSQEYLLAAKTFELDRNHLFELSLSSLEHVFVPEAKQDIAHIWRLFKRNADCNDDGDKQIKFTM